MNYPSLEIQAQSISTAPDASTKRVFNVKLSASVTWTRSRNAMPAVSPPQSIDGSAPATPTGTGVLVIDTAGLQISSTRKDPLGLEIRSRTLMPKDLGLMAQMCTRLYSQRILVELRGNCKRLMTGLPSPPSSWVYLGQSLLRFPLFASLLKKGLYIQAASSCLCMPCLGIVDLSLEPAHCQVSSLGPSLTAA